MKELLYIPDGVYIKFWDEINQDFKLIWSVEEFVLFRDIQKEFDLPKYSSYDELLDIMISTTEWRSQLENTFNIPKDEPLSKEEFEIVDVETNV